MEINLTGAIAANLVQPWYNPIMNMIAGMTGGFIALAGVWISQKMKLAKH